MAENKNKFAFTQEISNQREKILFKQQMPQNKFLA